MPLTIVGAGLAGLLAGNMLRRRSPVLIEHQPELPNNHHAVLRFRSSLVATQLGIPFRAVKVFKSCDEPDPVKAAMLYSRKVTGRYEVRSLINLDPVERYIAPGDLVEQMAQGLDIRLNTSFGFRSDGHANPVISTIPMEALMGLLEYPGARPSFVSQPGWVINCEVADCDVFCTRYFARHCGPVYRASITGNVLAVEAVGDPPCADVDPLALVRRTLMDFGITGNHSAPKVHTMRYAKIGELSADDRRKARDFMFWATHERNVYSLGRFATWRAGLLLDHLVNDVTQIERWIASGAYEIKKAL
jgi:hypothetical protein